MKFSIITVSFNSEKTISDTLRSVAMQNYPDVEHIVVDAASKDGTIASVERHLRQTGRWISEPDNGLYDAMNKGIALATGDIIGLLNSDDHYADADVLARVANRFAEKNVDAVLCDVGFFQDGAPERIVRRYDSGYFRPARLGWGWMPAHPGMFLTKAVYAEIGGYRTDYSIAADFEFVARAFGSHRATFDHLPEIAVMMRLGGVSTAGLKSKLTINAEVLRACRENGIYSNTAMLLAKYPRKMLEMMR
jgi:glycosyltransferase involved in cell wall biosynthesis